MTSRPEGTRPGAAGTRGGAAVRIVNWWRNRHRHTWECWGMSRLCCGCPVCGFRKCEDGSYGWDYRGDGRYGPLVAALDGGEGP